MSGSMGARKILDLLDLTLLDSGASEEELAGLCDLASRHRTAAVCVFPEHAGFVKGRIGPVVSLALVAGGFPRGSDSPDEIFDAVSEAASKGADEIDCVLEPNGDPSFPGDPS